MATTENTPANVTTTYAQPNLKPTAKVAAVGTAGVIITLLVALLGMTGIVVPEGLTEQASQAFASVLVIVSFVQTVVTFVSGYIKKSNTK